MLSNNWNKYAILWVFFFVTVGKKQVEMQAMMAGILLAALVSGSCYCAGFEYGRGFINNVNCDNCAFPAVRSQNVSGGKSLLGGRGPGLMSSHS